MTRPRSQQILDLQTRFSRLQYTPLPGATRDRIALGTVHSASVTAVEGGADESTPAYVTSTATPPYTILAGDAITVTVDAGIATTVTFASTDTTASRVAARINTTVGSTVAFADAGILSIRGSTVGSTGQVILADFVAGTLTKLGLVAGTYNGVDAPNRGIVTVSLDLLGGTALLKTLDGQDILTDTSASILIGDGFLPPVRVLDVPGGVPMHARVTADATWLYLDYYARMPTRAEVETFNSDLASLDGTDTVTFTVDDPEYGFNAVIVATFPSGPLLTRDQVVTRINDLWSNALTISGSGASHVQGTISQPFTFNGVASSIDIAVDGGAFTSVDLTGAVTVADVVALINGAVAGVTASPVSLTNGIFLAIRSNNTDGTTSSLEIRPTGGFSDALQALGLTPGLYKGYYLCQPSGPSEIKFFGVGRGSQATITVASGNPTTLTRLGLPAGVYGGLDEGEQLVSFPAMAADIALVEPVIVLFPEVMDFGEVPVQAESTVAKFLNRSNSDVRIQSVKLYSIDQFRLDGSGLNAAGHTVSLGPDGLLPLTVTAQVRTEYENFFKKFIRGDFSARTVIALVANNIETGGVDGNTTDVSDTFTVDIDPTGGWAGSPRYFKVQFGRDATAYLPFQVHSFFPLIDGVKWFVEAQDDAGDLAAFANTTGAMRLYDLNMATAGTATTGKKIIPVTSSTVTQGDDTLRIFGKREGNLEAVTLFRQINAKWVTTVGDGTVSFGDFNGVNAIQQALTFWNAYVGAADSTVRIQVKKGNYTISAANGLIDVPADMHLILEGEGWDASIITLTDGTNPAVRANSNCKLELRDLRLVGSGFDLRVQVKTTSRLAASDVKAWRAHFEFDDGYAGQFERCSILANSTTSPLVSILAGDGIQKDGYTFFDCDLTSGDNLPVLKVASSIGGYTGTGRILFCDCRIRLGSTTVDANNNLVGNCGVVDLDPNGYNSFGGLEGAYIDHLEYRDCEVTANTTAGAVSVLIHLIPIANGGATTATPFVTTDSSLRVDRFVIAGGKWIAPRSNTTVNPFTVGLSWTDETFPEANLNSGRVEIRDVVIGFDQAGTAGVNHGYPTQDLGSFFTTTEFGGARPATAIWGAIAIAANYLFMRGVTLVGMSQLGESGDLFLKCDRMMDVDGIFLEDYKLSGPLTAPTDRVRVRTGNYSAGDLRGNFSIRNVFMRGSDALAGSWGTNLFSVEPNSSGASTSQTSLEVSGVRIMGFTVVGVPSATVGFRYVNALFGSLYTGSAGSFDRFYVSKLQIRDCLTGIQALLTNSVFGTWSITDSEVSFCTNGVFLSSSAEIGDFTFCRNKVHANTTSGVYVQVGDWITTDEFAPCTIVANDNVIRNNPNASGVQMQVFASAVAGNHLPRGSVIGNSFGGGSSTEGDFKVNQISAGVSSALTSPANPGPPNQTLRGVQTGHSLADANTLLYQNNFSMYNNQGFLVTP